MADTNTTPAATALAAEIERTEELTDKLGRAILEFARNAETRPSDWGFAGNMAHINEKLIECIVFLGGEA